MGFSNTESEAQWAWNWDEEKRTIYDRAMRAAQNDVNKITKDFSDEQLGRTIVRDFDEHLGRTLPALAQNFDGKALADLKRANLWLAVFERGSKRSWGEAKDAFLADGPAVLDTLTSLTEKIRYESGIEVILSVDANMSTQLLLAILQELESDRNGYGGMRVLRPSTELTKDTLAACEARGIANDRIETLVKTRLKADENKSWFTKLDLRSMGDAIARILFRLIWDSLCVEWKPFENEDLIRHHFSHYIKSVMLALSNLKDAYIWLDYSRKVQSFVRQVGCARVHEDPEENIAELRLFHSTTIGYFAKLQEQYVKQELQIKKLRHHISALELRHLLEHLPDINLDKNAGPRWVKFWQKALDDEADNYLNKKVRAQPHALESLVEKRNQTRAKQDPHGNISGPKGPMTIHKEGQHGFLFSTGHILYSILSDEIHHYRGEEFLVGDDDGWSEVVTELLCALKPLRANINATTFEVDWNQERLRYV